MITPLKIAIDARGIKQRFLADRMGINFRYLSEIVRGRKVATPEQQTMLARILGTARQELFPEE